MDSALITRLREDFPEYSFRSGKKFAFRPPKTIVIGPNEPNDPLLLLHELGHALSKHFSFKTDISRIKMEREAWDKAKELAQKYGVEYDEDFVEQELDTYRNWLDAKSRCPKCSLTRYQTPDGKYHCPRCESIFKHKNQPAKG